MKLKFEVTIDTKGDEIDTIKFTHELAELIDQSYYLDEVIYLGKAGDSNENNA